MGAGIFPDTDFSSRISQFSAKIPFSHPLVDSGKRTGSVFQFLKKGKAHLLVLMKEQVMASIEKHKTRTP